MIKDYNKQQVIDLQESRDKATFNKEQLSYVIFGSKDNYQNYLKLSNLIENDPVFDKSQLNYMDRSQQLEWSFKVAKRMIELKHQHSLSDMDIILMISIIDVANPVFLHTSVFLNAIRTQTDDEQRKLWLKDTEEFKMIGCYAQTELGHGSALSNLETTATYDKSSDSFIIHSPTFSSAKFWPGGMAFFSNHCLVYAQLIIDNKNYGPHAFVVPIRDMKDHSILPNIKLFDIGPKIGMNTVDNGCAMFDKVKVPRKNMLMKFSKVDPNGNYFNPPHGKLVYAVMTGTRVSVIQGCWIPLARTLTIAIRYTTVRRQGPKPNTLEPKVINYIMVQYKLFSLLATTFALNFIAKWMTNKYHFMMNQIQSQGDVSLLPSTHAISTALKVYGTQASSDGVEMARRALGGHGYLISSGIANIYNSHVASMTYEGDNSLLTQQTARYLLKQYSLLINDQLIEDEELKGLNQFKNQKYFNIFSNDKLDIITIIKMFLTRVYHQVDSLYQLSKQHSWESLNIECSIVSDAYAHYLTLSKFYLGIQEHQHQPFYNSLNVLLDIYAINTILVNSAEFLQFELLDPKVIPKLRLHLKYLFKLLLPNVNTIVDAFTFSDYTINSSLGTKKGNAYENLVKDLDNNPLNNDQHFQKRLQKIVKEITHLDSLELKNKL